MNSYYVGTKTSPSFLMEVDKKKKVVTVYAPDTHSRRLEDVYERYVLGKAVLSVKYDALLFLRPPVPHRGFLYAPEAMIVGKRIWEVSKAIQEWKRG